MQPKVACKACVAPDVKTIDRLLVFGHGTRFVAQRWGLPRKAVALHRDRCLVGDRRQAVEADLRGMAGEAEEAESGVAR